MIRCGEKVAPLMPLLTLVFSCVGLALGWGIRRFHNNISMFSNPTSLVNRKKRRRNRKNDIAWKDGISNRFDEQQEISHSWIWSKMIPRSTSLANLGQLLRWPNWIDARPIPTGMQFIFFRFDFSTYGIVHVLHRQSHGVARALFGMSSPTLPSERYPIQIPLVHRPAAVRIIADY